jgi:hypothetical protein
MSCSKRWWKSRISILLSGNPHLIPWGEALILAIRMSLGAWKHQNVGSTFFTATVTNVLFSRKAKPA